MYTGRLIFMFVWHAVLFVPMVTHSINLDDKAAGIGVDFSEMDQAQMEVASAYVIQG